MGIRGLTTFLWEHYGDSLFQVFQLHDCHVIIDGNNLMFALFHSCPDMNSCLGGDYLKYKEYLANFFLRMKLCNVSATVVMDGGHDKSEIKFKTCWNRAKEQAWGAVHVGTANRRFVNVLSIFVRDTFFDACSEASNVNMIQTNFEADTFMALLSIEKSCPLLSNDSDFFVHHVTLIPINSLACSISKGCKDGNKFVACKVFNREAFMAHFGFKNPDLLYLMASVLGNDYVAPNTFQHFFGQIKKPKKKSLSDRHKVMEGFLAWLGRESDTTQAIDKILVTIPKDQRPKLRSDLESSLRMYGDLSQADSVTMNSGITSKVTAFGGGFVADWFLQDFRTGVYPGWFLDITCNRQVFLKSQVEARDKMASHLYAEPLLKQLIHFLVSFDSDYPIEVKVFIRQGAGIRNKVMTFEEAPTKSLADLRSLSQEDKLTYLCQLCDLPKALQGDLVTSFNPLLCLGLYLWTAKETFLSELELKVIVLAFFLQRKKESKAKQHGKTNQQMLVGGKKFGLDFVHATSNLQAILFYLWSLARLIDCKLLQINIWNEWNGTLLFNLLNEVHAYRDLDHIKIILDKDPNVFNNFCKVYESFKGFCLNMKDTVQFQGKRKGKKKASKAGSSNKVLADLDNKFSVLSVNE